MEDTVYLQPVNGASGGHDGQQFMYHGNAMNGQGQAQAQYMMGYTANGYYYPPQMQGHGYAGQPQSPVYLQPGQQVGLSTSPPAQQGVGSQEEEWMGECPCCAGNPYSCPSRDCRARGFCGCMFGYEDNMCYEEEDDTWKDEWFPDSRMCTCCNGYIYRCEKRDVLCESGACECSHVKGGVSPKNGEGPESGQRRSGDEGDADAASAALQGLDLNNA